MWLQVCEFGRGDIVGEMEFLHDHNTVADVVAKSDEVFALFVSGGLYQQSRFQEPCHNTSHPLQVRTARLERKHFEMCMGSLKDLLKSSRQVFLALLWSVERPVWKPVQLSTVYPHTTPIYLPVCGEFMCFLWACGRS